VLIVLVVGGVQVFFRYVIGNSLFWSEELMRVTMIWLVMLTAGLAYSRGQFLGMRLLVDRLPAGARRAADVLSALLMIGFLAVVFWFSLKFSWMTKLQSVPAMQVSLLWIHGSLAVGTALLMLHIVLDTFFGRPFADPNAEEEFPL
jgi:TRAP-type C4-dicarboxylate transport system permease small subunit